MRSRASDALIGGSGLALAGYLLSRTVQGLLIAAISGGLFWLVWIYGNGLRDPRYLDGWVLAGGMALQLSFHIAKTAGLSSKSAMRWRKIHIFAGYLVSCRLHLAFGFLPAGHRLRMGAVDGLCAGDAERHFGHLSRMVAAGQGPDRRERQL